MVNYNFKNQVVLITGAAKGIGASTAEKFLESGADLVLVDIDSIKLMQFKKELQSLHKKSNVLTIEADISKETDVQLMTKKAIDYYNRIDILFNNAGITIHRPLSEMTLAEWNRIMKINLDGVFLVAREIGNKMIEQKKGRIINTASMSGYIVNENRDNAAYCVSKAGVIMLTKALAVEWAKYNIVVNAIAPGYTVTPLISEALQQHPEKKKLMENRVPSNRLASPEEIALAVLYLASPNTTYITGHTLVIDGGYTIW